MNLKTNFERYWWNINLKTLMLNSSIMIQSRKTAIIITASMTGIIHVSQYLTHVKQTNCMLNIQYKDIQFIKVYWFCSKHQLVRLTYVSKPTDHFYRQRDPGGRGESAPFWIKHFPRKPHHISTMRRFTKYTCENNRSITNSQ